MKNISFAILTAVLSLSACSDDDSDTPVADPVEPSLKYETLNGRWVYSPPPGTLKHAVPLMIRNATAAGGELIYLGSDGNVCSDWTGYSIEDVKVIPEDASCEVNLSISKVSGDESELKIDDAQRYGSEDDFKWQKHCRFDSAHRRFVTAGTSRLYSEAVDRNPS